MTVSQETIENLERVLKRRFGKMSKSKPLDFEITEDGNKIRRLFEDNAIPVEGTREEDTLLNEAQQQANSIKETNKRIGFKYTASFINVK
jgi:hypothetical protein